MKCIILAAGYATRLYPLTKNTPKPLLKVAGKVIVEHIISKVEELELVDNIYIVTNDKFSQDFVDWLNNFDAKKTIKIVNDKTKNNDDRLGALGDINYTINTKNIDDDVIVIAGDNLFELSLKEFVTIFDEKKQNMVVLHDVKGMELAKYYGVVQIDENRTVVNFEEKPASPKSTLISTGIYLFPKKTLPLIKKYIDQGNNTDKSGSFIEWLHKRAEVYAYVTDETWYDIGSFKQLEEANKNFKG